MATAVVAVANLSIHSSLESWFPFLFVLILYLICHNFIPGGCARRPSRSEVSGGSGSSGVPRRPERRSFRPRDSRRPTPLHRTRGVFRHRLHLGVQGWRQWGVRRVYKRWRARAVEMPKRTVTTSRGGGRTRTVVCTECGRQFRGAPKFVEKLVALHCSKTHGYVCPELPVFQATNTKPNSTGSAANPTSKRVPVIE